MSETITPGKPDSSMFLPVRYLVYSFRKDVSLSVRGHKIMGVKLSKMTYPVPEDQRPASS